PPRPRPFPYTTLFRSGPHGNVILGLIRRLSFFPGAGRRRREPGFFPFEIIQPFDAISSLDDPSRPLPDASRGFAGNALVQCLHRSEEHTSELQSRENL